jgi:hypothetical protein
LIGDTDDRSNLECRAGGRHRDAGEHRPALVGYLANDAGIFLPGRRPLGQSR